MKSFKEFLNENLDEAENQLQEKASKKDIKALLDFGKSEGHEVGTEKNSFGTFDVVKIKGSDKEVNDFLIKASKKGIRAGVLSDNKGVVNIAHVDQI